MEEKDQLFKSIGPAGGARASSLLHLPAFLPPSPWRAYLRAAHARVSSAFYIMHKNTNTHPANAFGCLCGFLYSSPPICNEAYPDTTRPTVVSVSYLPSTGRHGGINMRASVLCSTVTA
ncbi:hypothetical protein OPV22_010825 [Ensete ventricosum]|uniref:Uncharacterized protein n=1 Tax=Ensete ventricosum TaxID=4639 RepID=A0AAV8R8A8_ENSVE|nr:hypothetical protein OPV22_010825 [Ensete ventricosum]